MTEHFKAGDLISLCKTIGTFGGMLLIGEIGLILDNAIHYDSIRVHRTLVEGEVFFINQDFMKLSSRVDR